jgi:hypothetical protein
LFWFPKKPRIEIFARHCHFSKVSAHKARPKGFTREKCFSNLLELVDKEKHVGLTFLLDTYHPMEGEHFVHSQNRYPIETFKAGSETGSFIFMLDRVLSKKMDDDTIIYFLEDDYWHLPGSLDILREGIRLPGVDYVTLYDHKDKYFLSQYQDLKSEVFHTASCHWRTTPSTTNTYAMYLKTLKRDEAIHRRFSQEGSISKDHEKFCALAAKGMKLISSIPGYASHLEADYLSPCTNWEKLLKSTI